MAGYRAKCNARGRDKEAAMPDLMVSEKVEMSWRYACRRCRREEVWKRRCFDGAEVVWWPVNDVESLGALANQVTTISCAATCNFGGMHEAQPNDVMDDEHSFGGLRCDVMPYRWSGRANVPPTMDLGQ